MQLIFLILATFFLAVIAGCSLQPAGGNSRPVEGIVPMAADRRPVLVELFTSEGCSSCPPADKALMFLENQQPVTKADVITLAFHVDYWDRLGWKDRFSSPLYSRRQEIYAQALKLDSNYTPQMVVDGQAELVGSDVRRASDAILKAVDEPKASIELTSGEHRVTVKIAAAPEHADSTIYAAIAEDGISTRVERGENSGKTLEHISVVRELKTVGMLESGRPEFEGVVDVQVGPEWKRENLKAVVFVQENESRKVIGAGRVKL